MKGLPFVGASGKLLDDILTTAGLRRGDLSITNVFLHRPPGNNLAAWGVKRKGLSGPLIPVGNLVVDPAISVPAVQRLSDELHFVRPNVVVALGNTALSALCNTTGIGKSRGTLYRSVLGDFKVIPTYHPAAVLRQFELLPVVELDFIKIARESKSPELRLRRRELRIIDRIEDLAQALSDIRGADILTFDIETKAGQITCIGLGVSATLCYVLPFWCRTATDGHHWSEREERICLQFLRSVFALPMPKLAQNGIYDVQYLLRYGIKVVNFSEDTMLLHHALFPSLPKGLDFLGSVYANERAWKRDRPRGGENYKREE